MSVSGFLSNQSAVRNNVSYNEVYKVPEGFTGWLSPKNCIPTRTLSIEQPAFGSPLSSGSSSSSVSPATSPAPAPIVRSYPTASAKNNTIEINDSDDSDGDTDVDIEVVARSAGREGRRTNASSNNAVPTEGYNRTVEYPASWVHSTDASYDAPYIPRESTATSARNNVGSPQRATRGAYPISPYKEDLDDEGDDESDGNGTEDEYRPSPKPTSLKRRRAFESASSSPAPPQHSSRRRLSSATATSATSSRAGVSTSSPVRSAQGSTRGGGSSSSRARGPSASGKKMGKASADDASFQCSYCEGVYTRQTDLTRHVKVVHEQTQRPRCSEVSVDRAIPWDIVVDRANIRFVDGQEVFGGCGKEFSRPDAVWRHLKQTKGTCVEED